MNYLPLSTPPTPNTEPSETFTWLNVRFGSDLSEDQVRHIMEFTLLWNCFEHDCFSCVAKLGKFNEKSIVPVLPHMDCAAYDALAKRFIARMKIVCAGHTDDPIPHYLGKLRAEPITHTAITQALTESSGSQDLAPRVLGLLLIARRVRNNLFHGEKNMESLPRQADLFENLNALLMRFMDDFRKSGAQPFVEESLNRDAVKTHHSTQ